MAGRRKISYRLIRAVQEGRLETVRELINSYGLSYSQEWLGGYALLCDALNNKHTEVAKLLLTSGSKVNSKNVEPSNTPLHLAAINGYRDIVKMLLDKGVKIDVKDTYGRNPFHCAIESKNVEVVELLLNHGADINYVCTDPWNSRGYTALHIAAKAGSREIITLLLNHRADVNVKGEDDITPLHVAAGRGDESIVEDLLNCGARIDSSTLEKGHTPLHSAIRAGHFTVVLELLVCGANIDVKGVDNITPLHISAEIGNEHIVRCLLSYEPCIDSSTLKEEHTPLHCAIRAGHHTVVQLLLQRGANVNNQDKDGTSILHHAVQTENAIIVKEVLKYRPDINNPSNRRSLITAVLGYGRECKKIFQALLKYGFVINPEDANNSELLYAAVGKKYFTIVQELLKYGADVNARDVYGGGGILLINAIDNDDLEMTKLLLTNGAHVNPDVLNTAVLQGHIDIVKALLEHGADTVDINAGDEYGRTALHHAVVNYHKEIVKVLFEHGANVESRDNDGSTPLHLGAMSGHQDAVETLLQLGADIDSRNNSGGTALNVACGHGRTEVVITLLKYGGDINITDFDNLTPIHTAVAAWCNKPELVDFFIRHIVKMKAASLYVSEEKPELVDVLIRHIV